MKEHIEKRCPMCGDVKPASMFYKNIKNGLSTYCKPCSADRKRKGDKTRKEIIRDIYPSGETKICSSCKKEKSLSSFNKRVRAGCKDSYRPCCKDCQSVIFKNWAEKTSGARKQKNKSRGEFIKNKLAARFPEIGMKLCSSCGEVKQSSDFGSRYTAGGNCKKCRSKADKISYAENKEARHAYAKKYRENNLENVRAMAIRGTAKRYRLLKAARESGRVSQSQKLKMIAAYGYKCMCCGATESITFDHIVPIAKGGKDVIDNLQLLCVSCNSSKATHVIDYRPDIKDAA